MQGDEDFLERVAVPAALLGALVGATNLLVMKAAFVAGFTPVVYGGLRFLVIGLLAGAALHWRGASLRPASAEGRRWLRNEALAKSVGALPIYLAVYLAPATVVLLLSFASPLVQLLMAGRMLDDRVGGRRAAGVGVALLGLVLWVVFQEAPEVAGGLTPEVALGMALAVVGVGCTSLLAMLQKKAFRAGATSLQSVLWSSVVPGSLWLAAATLRAGGAPELPAVPMAWLFFAWSCTISGVGLFAYRRWLVSRYQVSFLATFSPISRLFGLCMAPALLGEVLPLRGLAAMAFVSLGSSLAWPRGAGVRRDGGAGSP